MPHDFFIGDVYVPPLLVAAMAALLLASPTTRFMRKHGVMDWFANPPLVFMSLVVLYTVILGSTLFPT